MQSMQRDGQNRRVVRFGIFEADLLTRELRKRGVRVRLQEQPFRLLQALLERPGQIVTREEIKDKLWPDDTFVDFDNSLNTAAQKLRQALGDSAESPRFVETIPRQGYRFLTPVAAVAPKDLPVTEEQAPVPDSVPTGLRFLLLPWALVGLLGLALAWSWVAASPEEQTTAGVLRFDLLPSLHGAAAERPGLYRSAFPAAISPSGSVIAYVSGEDPPRVWLHELATAKSRAVDGTEGTLGLFWAPDSGSLALIKRKSLEKVDLHRGAVTRLHNSAGSDDSYVGGVWNPDGESIFFSAGTAGAYRVYQAPASGGEARPLPGIRGRHLAFLPSADPAVAVDSPGGISLARLDTGEITTLVPDGRHPSWSPSGHIVFDLERSIWALPFSLENLEATSEPFLVESGFVNGGVSSDGALLALSYEAEPNQLQLAIRNRDGELLGTVGPTLSSGDHPAVSPDGSQVAVGASLQPGGTRDIWLFEIEGRASRRLTTDPDHDITPVWTPDGSRVLFRRTKGEDLDADYFSVEASGGGAVDAVLDDDGRVAEFTLSPDGTLVFQHRPLSADQFDLAVLELAEDGSKAQPRPWLNSEFNEAQPQFSPNGKYVAYNSGESGRAQIYVRRFPAGSPVWQVSIDGGGEPRWSRDGKELFWWTWPEGRPLMATKVDFSQSNPFSEPEELFANGFESRTVNFYDVLPDGRFIIVEPARRQEGGEDRPVVLRVTQNWASAVEVE